MNIIEQAYQWFRNSIGLIKPDYRLDIFFYLSILILCYFCFNHPDILTISGWSFTYLNGHIKDFYEVNKNFLGGCNYFPSTSILYAIWNIPIKLLGLVNEPVTNVGNIIFWYKLLPTLFFIGSSYFMYKIGKVIKLSFTNSVLLTIIWISSPILFFSMFIFGQTDIFTTFFTLIGLWYFLQKKFVLFAVFLGISMTFKYFPLLIFMPLLFLAEKNIFKILGYLILFFMPMGFEYIFYADSAAFRTEILGGPVESIISPASLVYTLRLVLFAITWFIICAICYYTVTPPNRATFYQTSFYICLTVVCILFILISWNPQYLLFMTPFLALTTFTDRRIKYFLLLDFVMMLSFIGYVACAQNGHVVQEIMTFGILGNLKPGIADQNGLFLMMRIFTFGTDSIFLISQIYRGLFCITLLLNIILKFPYKGNLWKGENNVVGIKVYWNYARFRFLAGMAVFIIPAFIVFFSIP